MRKLTAFIAVLGVLACAVPARAQTRRTYWGVSGGVVPQWEVPSVFKQLFDADSIVFEGSEFRIGFVRGSIFDGDWGVSLIRKNVSDKSTVARPQTGQCAACGLFLSASSASFTGVEIHKFVPFGTIKQRVQVGMNFAGGVAQLNGTAHEVSISRTGSVNQDVAASAMWAPFGKDITVIPLAKVELGVAAILGPDLKIRAAGGFDMPGYDKFNVSIIYLFGAR